jgi:hypothetical protein
MQASLKKNILIGIAAAAGLLLFAALGWLVYFKLQFSVYQDAQNKFSIKYPSSWKVLVNPQPNVAVIFLRPKDTALDTVQENFNVTVQAVPADIFNLAQFSARIKIQMTAVFGKSINIVEDKPLHWGWREGHMWAFEAPDPDHLKMVNAWVLKDNQAYILTFLGDMNKYSKDGLYVSEMVRSFQLQ